MTGYKSKKKSAEAKLTEAWPKVVVGNHLTVTTYEDGRTELTWDDEALLKEVQEAIASVGTVETPKKTRKKK